MANWEDVVVVVVVVVVVAVAVEKDGRRIIETETTRKATC